MQAQIAIYDKDRSLMTARRTQAAFDVLVKNAMVDPSRIALIGYCFGGGVGIEFAATGAPLAANVAIHGSFRDRAPDGRRTRKGMFLILHGAEDVGFPLTDLQPPGRRDAQREATLPVRGLQRHRPRLFHPEEQGRGARQRAIDRTTARERSRSCSASEIMMRSPRSAAPRLSRHTSPRRRTPSRPRTRAPLRAVIEAQLDAFRRDDAARACLHSPPPASAATFGDAETFIGNESAGPNAVSYRPKERRLRAPLLVHGELVQPVRPHRREGRAWLASTPCSAADGSWRTNGCLARALRRERRPKASLGALKEVADVATSRLRLLRGHLERENRPKPTLIVRRHSRGLFRPGAHLRALILEVVP